MNIMVGYPGMFGVLSLDQMGVPTLKTLIQ